MVKGRTPILAYSYLTGEMVEMYNVTLIDTPILPTGMWYRLIGEDKDGNFLTKAILETERNSIVADYPEITL